MDDHHDDGSRLQSAEPKSETESVSIPCYTNGCLAGWVYIHPIKMTHKKSCNPVYHQVPIEIPLNHGSFSGSFMFFYGVFMFNRVRLQTKRWVLHDRFQDCFRTSSSKRYDESTITKWDFTRAWHFQYLHHHKLIYSTIYLVNNLV